jgi:general secretion pathway protein E
LHTNTAVGSVTRLRDMGVEKFLLSSSLLGVMAQRLVRTLCPNCKEAASPTQSERQLLLLRDDEDPVIYHAKGCEQCSNTGYRGRTGIYELVLVDEKIRGYIHDGASEQKIEKYARTQTTGIRHDGFRKVYEGSTTLEEVVRVTYAD